MPAAQRRCPATLVLKATSEKHSHPNLPDTIHLLSLLAGLKLAAACHKLVLRTHLKTEDQ